jgi:hypothetical protein
MKRLSYANRPCEASMVLPLPVIGEPLPHRAAQIQSQTVRHIDKTTNCATLTTFGGSYSHDRKKGALSFGFGASPLVTRDLVARTAPHSLSPNAVQKRTHAFSGAKTQLAQPCSKAAFMNANIRAATNPKILGRIRLSRLTAVLVTAIMLLAAAVRTPMLAGDRSACWFGKSSLISHSEGAGRRLSSNLIGP